MPGTVEGELKGLLGSNGNVNALIGFNYENTSDNGVSSYVASIITFVIILFKCFDIIHTCIGPPLALPLMPIT